VLGALVFLAVKTQGKKSILFLLLAYLIGLGFFTAIHFLNKSALAKKEILQVKE
jgi:cytochrome c biogenesis protein CcdA